MTRQHIKQQLMGCNFEVAKTFLAKQFDGSIIPNELARLLRAYHLNPGIDTAADLIQFDSDFSAIFELCRHDGIAEQFYKQKDIK